MTLTKYMKKLTNLSQNREFNKKIIEHKTPKIHAISTDRNEYERNKTLIDNSLNKVLWKLVLQICG